MELYDVLGRYPFEIVKDINITEQAARTVDMLNDVLKNVVRPALDLGSRKEVQKLTASEAGADIPPHLRPFPLSIRYSPKVYSSRQRVVR